MMTVANGITSNMLRRLGFSDRFEAESKNFPGLYVGRIIAQYNKVYKLMSQQGELNAEVSGKFSYEAIDLSAYPVVGDFVMIDRMSDKDGNAIISQVLRRKSVLKRKSAGTSCEGQIIASNVDTVFICMSANNDFNIRRTERYLSIVWDSGATPVVVITKSDLADNLEEKLSELSSVAVGVEVLVTSAIEGNIHDAFQSHLVEGQTIALIGSSGVGKSTLINCLLGAHAITTRDIRDDDKGRHTTTRRELFMLDQGGMLIDTPGMREIGIDDADFSKSFADIEGLAMQCRFNNCSHMNEPDCAVQGALESGELSSERLSNYQKLKREAGYVGLNSREIEMAKINQWFDGIGELKQARRFFKEQNAKRGRG